MLDAARFLLVEGVDPATQIVMGHEGQNYGLRSTIGSAALDLGLRRQRTTRGATLAMSYDAISDHG
jgi:hypothetical protein